MDRFIKKKPAAAAPSAPAAKKEAAVSDKEVLTEKTASAPSASAAVPEAAYRVIVKPLVTEKSAVLQSRNHYTFVVASSASKANVKEAVRALYGATPSAVNLINVAGRRLRFGGRAGRRSDFKKAIVTFPPGVSITVHRGV